MKTIKYIYILVTVVFLALSPFACYGTAQSSPNAVPFLADEVVYSIFHPLNGSKTYILTNTGIYTMNSLDEAPADVSIFNNSADDRYETTAPADDTAKEVWRNQINHIFGDDQNIFGLNTRTGGVFKLEESGFAHMLDFDWSKMLIGEEPDKRFKITKQPVLIGDKVYVLTESQEEYGDGALFEILEYSMNDGSCKSIGTGPYTAMTQYKDGKILLLNRGDETSYNKSRIYAVSPDWQSMDLVAECETSYSGALGYDMQNNTVFFMDQATFKCVADGDMRFIQNVTQHIYADMAMGCTVGSNGYIVYTPYDTHFALRTDSNSAGEMRQLYIADYEPSEASNIFLSEHPETQIYPVEMVDQTPEKIYTAIASGDDSVDVFVLSLTDGFAAMRDRGYLADLSSSVFLMDETSQYIEQISNILLSDDKLYGVPRNISMDFWTLHNVPWEQLSLGDFPSTFRQFIEMVTDWYEQSDENQDYLFVSPSIPRSHAARTAILYYILQTDTGELPVSFSDADFTATLEYIAQMPTEEDIAKVDLSSSTKEVVIDVRGGTPTRISSGNKDMIIPPVVSTSYPKLVRASMNVYVVNPNSNNKDLAIAYLESVAQVMDLHTQALLKPDIFQEVLDPQWGPAVAAMHERVEELQLRMPNAEPQDIALMEQEISDLENAAENEEMKWLMNAQDIAAYKEIVPYLNFGENSLFLSISQSQHFEELVNLANRYVEGESSIDSAIEEMNRYSTMVFMEGR